MEQGRKTHHRFVSGDFCHAKLILLFGKIVKDKLSAGNLICLEFHTDGKLLRYKGRIWSRTLRCGRTG